MAINSNHSSFDPFPLLSLITFTFIGRYPKSSLFTKPAIVAKIAMGENYSAPYEVGNVTFLPGEVCSGPS